MSRGLSAAAAVIAERAVADLEQLVAISTPSGDVSGAERAIERCIDALPGSMEIERPACSTDGCAPDLIARLSGFGTRRLLLLGHLDTVVAHPEHQELRRDGDRLYGSGTIDMKGGVALAVGVANELALDRDAFAELAVLLVCDEEWRTGPLVQVPAFSGYDACLCFEAGELADGGGEGVIVRRKGAGTLRVRARGRASHSGAAPERGRNALLALAQTAVAVAATNDPEGPQRMTVVPTVIRSGAAFNVVPAEGELVFDIRSDDISSFERVLAAVPTEVGGAQLEPVIERLWPAMDAADAAAPAIAQAALSLGRPVVAAARGGASDASHFAPTIPVTIDGLGPRGGGAHTPEEFVFAPSLGERAEVALALASAVLVGSDDGSLG